MTFWTSVLGREPLPRRWFRSACGVSRRTRHAGRDGTVEPCVAVDVVLLHRLAGDAGDDAGGVAHRECLGAGRCVLGAGVGVGARECRGGDRGDVLSLRATREPVLPVPPSTSV